EKLETLKETLEAKVASGINTCPTKVEGGSKSVDQNHFVNDINREHTEVLQVQNNKSEAIETLIYGATGKQKLLYNQSDIAYNLVKDAKQSVYGFTSGNETTSNLTKEIYTADTDKENDNHHIVLKQDYAVYGQAKRSMLEETPQFNGEMLSSGNLTYMRARSYDPTLGQFTSKDTWIGKQSNPLSQNRNTFVENNPINFVDPSGHWPDWVKEKVDGVGHKIDEGLKWAGENLNPFNWGR
ncbi:MAG: RHS repeat-associated core domain-containing protein, partial [Culicoidibacterales bacterium]